MAATDAGLTQLVVGVYAGYQLYGEEWLYMGRENRRYGRHQRGMILACIVAVRECLPIASFHCLTECRISKVGQVTITT